MNHEDLHQNWQKQKIESSKGHQFKAFETVNDLVVKERQHRKVILSTGEELIEFMSCSYLGLDQDARIIEAAMNSIRKCGVNFAVARSRMRVESFVNLEALLNKIFGGFSVVFTSLHLVHLGILPLIGSGEMPSYPLSEAGICFILDKTVHTSIQINRGLMQQFGEVDVVSFCNIEAVERLFHLAKSNKKTPIAIADGIGSMGGMASVKQLIDLAVRYNGYVYIDDAHGTSLYGKNGCGYTLMELGGYHPRLILSISLSKGFGANGAAIIMPTLNDEKMVRRFSIPYLFSNPNPLAIVDSAIASAQIHLSDEIYLLQNKLQEKIRLFDTLISTQLSKNIIINFKSHSPIRGILVKDEYKTIQICSALRKNGLAVTAAMYPTVAKGQSILRITLAADHKDEEIRRLCSELNHLLSN
jgi:7-keto-8-aminopelargonate synthetase-like enzyme